MIQRIQSIYLLLVAILMVAFLFVSFAHSQEFSLSVQGVSVNGAVIATTWGVFILNAVTALIACMTIFLYKNRPSQARLCLGNALFMVTLYAVIFLVIHIKGLDVSLSPTITIPFVALVLDLLAYRAIKKDEKLVRSLDRVR